MQSVGLWSVTSSFDATIRLYKCAVLIWMLSTILNGVTSLAVLLAAQNFEPPMTDQWETRWERLLFYTIVVCRGASGLDEFRGSVVFSTLLGVPLSFAVYFYAPEIIDHVWGFLMKLGTLAMLLL